MEISSERFEFSFGPSTPIDLVQVCTRESTPLGVVENIGKYLALANSEIDAAAVQRMPFAYSALGLHDGSTVRVGLFASVDLLAAWVADASASGADVVYFAQSDDQREALEADVRDRVRQAARLH